jgi:hypothetical protein
MKNLFVNQTFKSIFLVGVLIISGFSINAQTFNKQGIAIFNYSVIIDDQLGLTTDKSMYDNIYNQAITILKDKAFLGFKPINYLEGKVAYDNLNYPLGKIKKAIKSGMADNYAKIIINVKPQGVISTNETTVGNGEVGYETGKMKCKIQVSVKMIIYNSNGEKLFEQTGEAVSSDKIIVEKESFIFKSLSITSITGNDANEQTFQQLLVQALENLAETIK